MFAYLLIAAELVILATVFWHVFLKEPRPFEIKENLWGYYDKPLDTCTNNGAQSVSAFMTCDTTNNIMESAAHKKDILRPRAHRHAHNLNRCNTDLRIDNSNQMKNGWIVIEDKPSNIVGAMLANLGEKITQLSLKFQ